MKKKIKVIILTIWFTLSIIFMWFSAFINSGELVAIGIVNTIASFLFIISDEELRDMNLF